MNTIPTITLDEQIACVKREIEYRSGILPQMQQKHLDTAKYELAAMQAVLRTLEKPTGRREVTRCSKISRSGPRGWEDPHDH